MPQSIYRLNCEDAIAFVCDAVWGFAELDKDGSFCWVNPAYCEILNAPPDLVLGSSESTWTHVDDREIDAELGAKVKSGDIPGYKLSKRYVQRGSTPKRELVQWGLQSVVGKWNNGVFVGFRVQFNPYDHDVGQSKVLMVDWKKLAASVIANWKTIVTVVAVSSTLIWGGSEKLLESIQKAKQVKDSVDGVLSPSSSGPSSPP